MRADRLVSLVLLLRQRGRLSAPELPRELEVSTRTVLRDIDALSTARIPVYADRGRQGGFSLLPGFRIELTGLTPDEALALLAVSSAGGQRMLGLNSALSSAMRKVADLLSRARVAESIPAAVMVEVHRAVLEGRRLRIHYAAEGRDAAWRDVDPIGLVTVREKGYLLATVEGGDRTYRLSRILTAEAVDFLR